MRRGQTALEFLTTYGWLLMVLLGFIIIMFLFSLNTDILIPERCVFPASTNIECVSHAAYTDGRLTLLLENKREQDIQLSDATCIYRSSVTVTTKNVLLNKVETREMTWPAGEFLHFSCQFKADNPFENQQGMKMDPSVVLTFADGEELEVPVKVAVRGE